MGGLRIGDSVDGRVPRGTRPASGIPLHSRMGGGLMRCGVVDLPRQKAAGSRRIVALTPALPHRPSRVSLEPPTMTNHRPWTADQDPCIAAFFASSSSSVRLKPDPTLAGSTADHDKPSP